MNPPSYSPERLSIREIGEGKSAIPSQRVMAQTQDSNDISTGSTIMSNGAFVVSDSMSMQRLSLDKAVSPLLPKPTAPFAKNERKRALLNASFYSECFLNAIGPVDADTAALDAQNRYEKWWVESKYKGGPDAKKRKTTESVTPIDSIPEARREEDQSNLIEIGEDARVDYGSPLPSAGCSEAVRAATVKAAMIEDLQKSGGDVSTSKFATCLINLHSIYMARGTDERWSGNDPAPVDGTWLTLSKPTFSECLGRNEKGQYLYTLGRLSFDMFRPTHVKCSLQGVFNSVSLYSDSDESRPKSFPKRMMKGLKSQSGSPPVRNYDIVVAFTIEANQTRHGQMVQKDESKDEYVIRKPIRGLLTNHGYMIPDPETPNRLSIWFSGGALEVHEDTDLEEWKHLFNEDELPRRDMGEYARVLAAKFLLGATSNTVMAEDGAMTYKLNRPIGGHGQVFCDVLYSDENFRVVRGHHGTTFVHTRVPTIRGN